MHSNSTDLTIRKASEADACLLAAIGLTVWVDTYAENALTPEVAEAGLAAFSKEAIQAVLLDSSCSVLMATRGTGALGFSVLRQDAAITGLKGKGAELERLYVIEAFCRQGIGTHLLESMIKQARIEGCTYLWVDVYSENLRALAFYRKQGFQFHSRVSFSIKDRLVPNERLVLSI